MRSAALAFMLAGGLCSPAIAAQTAFSCSLVGARDASVLVGKVPRHPPMWLENCEGLRVLDGEVTVCYMNRAERRVCRGFDKGQTISAKALPKGGVERFAYFSVLELLKGDPATVSAATRDILELPGFPYDKTLLLNNTLRIDLTRAGLPQFTTFELRETDEQGPVHLHVDHPTGEIRLDAGQLQRGQSYAWTVRAGEPSASHSGYFRLATAEELAGMQAELAEQAADQEAGSVGLAVLQAQWLADAGYRFDAEERLLASGLALR